MSRVVFRPLARRDFDDIADFIAQDNADRALAFITELEGACRKLADFPHSGRRRDDIIPGLLSFPYRNYVIYYVLLAGGDGIEVAHIIHGARDQGRILRNEDTTPVER